MEAFFEVFVIIGLNIPSKLESKNQEFLNFQYNSLFTEVFAKNVYNISKFFNKIYLSSYKRYKLTTPRFLFIGPIFLKQRAMNSKQNICKILIALNSYAKSNSKHSCSNMKSTILTILYLLSLIPFTLSAYERCNRQSEQSDRNYQ